MIGKEILNYRITGIIGQGGMGTVYMGVNKFIQEQKVAIKVINHDMLNDFTRKRLEEEAHRLASLNHPNIVRLINFHKDEKGSVYLIMEFAEGVSIEKFIREINGLVVVDRICPLFEPILDGIAAAHNHKTKDEDGKLVPDPIIHCDIKPSNIVITLDKEPKIKILDFGIAQIVNEQDGESKMVMGTPSYMSPEQIKGEKLDARSDIYSLGVLLHQMLTGNAPYDTTTLTEQQINQKVVEEPLPRMATYYKYIPEKIQKIVDKATAKRPEDRFQSCEEFKKALHKAVYPTKMPLWAKVASVAAVLIVVGVAGYIWDYNRIKTYYYKDYVEQWGIPQGIGELSSSEHGHSRRSYKFTYQKRHLLRVSHVNSKDHLIEDGESERNERPIDQEFSYTEDGKVSHIKVKDRGGKVLYVKSYNDKLNVMVFQYDDEHNTERVLSGSTVGYGRLLEDNYNNDHGHISRWWIEYDDDGFVTSEKYYSIDNSPVGDENGIYGRTYVRDKKGRPLEIHYIGIDGNPQPTKWGLGIKKYEYDEDDNWIKCTYLTVDGKPAYDDTDGLAIYSLEYDDYGNVVNAYHFDGEGKPMIPQKNNVAGVHYVYDDDGQITEEDYLGIDHKPMFVKGAGFAIVKYEYDENGYVTKESLCDPSGNPVASQDGNAFREYVNDEQGNQIEEWFKNVNGKLCETSAGYAGIRQEFDSIGNLVKLVYYGTDKKPVLVDGKAGFTIKYNELNLEETYVSLGKNMKPAPNDDGRICVRFEYDKRGNTIKVSYFEADEKTPRLDIRGVAGFESKYDDKGNLLEQRYFGVKGNTVTSLSDHYAKIKFTYDDNGNVLTLRYLTPSDELTLVNGIAGWDYVRDKRGNVLEEKPVGINGGLAAGSLISKYKYDKFNNCIEHSLYEASGEPALDKFGVHRYEYVFNSHNQMIEQRNYNTNGQLIMASGNNSFAIMKNEFDDKGNRIKASYFGPDKQPCVCSEGWSSSKYEYDVFGNIIKQSFFGVDGKPTDPSVMVPVGICKYDNNGNMLFIAAQDGKGHYIINPNTGWAIQRATYDDKSQLVSTAFFDADDKAMIGPDGYHKVTYKYNNNSHKTEEAYFGTDGKPMVGSGGCHMIKYRYDDNGNEIEEAYFGTDGKPMLVNGIHMERMVYNINGLATSVAYYNKAGKPTDCDAGFHKITLTYNDNGQYTSRKFYRANGSLLGSQTYNFSTMSWNELQVAGGTSGNSSSGSSGTSSEWKNSIKEANSECPLKIADGVYVQSFSTSGNSVTIVIKLAEVSKYNMTDEMENTVKEIGNQVRTNFKSSFQLPSSVAVHVKIIDKAERVLYNK